MNLMYKIENLYKEDIIEYLKKVFLSKNEKS